MFSNFMYIFTLLAFSVSKPWREEFYTNKPFTAILVVVLGFSSMLMLFPGMRIDYMELSRFNYKPLMLALLGLSWGFGLAIYGIQKLILEPWFNHIQVKKKEKNDSFS